MVSADINRDSKPDLVIGNFVLDSVACECKRSVSSEKSLRGDSIPSRSAASKGVESPTAITHGSRVFPVLSSVWQSHGNH